MSLNLAPIVLISSMLFLVGCADVLESDASNGGGTGGMENGGSGGTETGGTGGTGTAGSSGAGGMGTGGTGGTGTAGSGGAGGVGTGGTGGMGGAPPSCAGEGEPCGTNAGECEFGQFVCEGNTAVCVGGVTETPETCDGRDNDCDNIIDNPPDGCACMNGSTQPCGTDEGECTLGQQTCAGGAWSACSQDPDGNPESCNGLDDDCNSTVDDLPAPGCQPDSRQPCTTGCGSTGTQTCGAACTWGSCQPPVEVCNGQDDDCLSGADNGFACVQGATVSCTTSCLSTGTGTCTGSCAIPTGDACAPPTEVCNGVDDDCDGQTDEGNVCPTGCSGGMFEGRTYYYCAVAMEYPDARAFCNTFDFDLIAIESPEENSFAALLVADGAPFVYTGGFLVDGDWRWNDGLVFWEGSGPGSSIPDVYANWAPDFPSSVGSFGPAVSLSVGLDGQWVHVGGVAGIEVPFICESR